MKYGTRNLLPAIDNSQGQLKFNSEQDTDNIRVTSTKIINFFNTNISIPC